MSPVRYAGGLELFRGLAAGEAFRGEENVRTGLGRTGGVFNAREEVELELDEEDITDAFRLISARVGV